MTTPICDFVKNYIEKDGLRLHMPGHKGSSFLGAEIFDITEIKGADSLYDADGIIKKSEENASQIFGADTFYSAEGSSLSIKAMLYLAVTLNKNSNEKPIVYAGRNAHKAFLSAAALIDFDVEWIYGKNNYLSCEIDANELDEKIKNAKNKPVAVYITSPDYLGNLQDIGSISAVCKKHGVLLLVDNAHGAYLKFMEKSMHPIDLGADMCADSAHKTLPVLTGGGYLHISKKLDERYKNQTKNAMLLFGSTSPSYLILQSLDMANKYIAENKEKYPDFAKKISNLKANLKKSGFEILGNEPFKITTCTKSYGYTGFEFAEELRKNGIECEFADPDFVVLMMSPQLEAKLGDIKNMFEKIPPKQEISTNMPKILKPEKVLDIRKAMFSGKEKIPTKDALGRILAEGVLSCPPAVAPIVCGEKIDESAIKCLEYYGIENLWVIK